MRKKLASLTLALALCLSLALCALASAADFSDVPSDAYYADAVAWCVEKGIVNGKAEGTFAPDEPLTRAAAVTVLWRAMGQPESAQRANFNDVDETSPFYPAICWAAEAGVVNGDKDGDFVPDGSMSNVQMLVILSRLLGESFSGPTVMEDTVAWAEEEGLTDSNIDSYAEVTRSSGVYLLWKAAPLLGIDTSTATDPPAASETPAVGETPTPDAVETPAVGETPTPDAVETTAPVESPATTEDPAPAPTETPAPAPTGSPREYIASDWARSEVARADELGLIPDRLVGQDLTKPITRAEFAAVVVKTYEALSGVAAIPVVNNPFTDCNDVEVLKAYNIGAVNGTGGANYSPEDLLNREQAATMLTRVFKKIALAGWTLSTDGQFTLPYEKPAPFADDGDISDWARDSVYFMAANGIILGDGDKFMPRAVTTEQQAQGYAQATREQALLIAVRMVENLGQ